jgi:2-iminobutanoate/2-iminopropanoate deaminase
LRYKSVAIGLAAFWLSNAALTAEPVIQRINKVPPRPTLDAVFIPAVAETLILSGQTPSPLDPAKIDGPDDFGDTRTQAQDVFAKIRALLEKQGWSMRDVVKLNVYLAAEPKLGAADFAAMNDVYAKYFGTADNPVLPARTVVEVKAFGRAGYRVEIEAIAARVPSK